MSSVCCCYLLWPLGEPVSGGPNSNFYVTVLQQTRRGQLGAYGF